LIKKITILIFFLILLVSTNAIPFGNETEDAVIESGSFKMMSQPELDSQLFIQFKLVGTDKNGLDGYHTELKIYDNRGVLIYPTKCNGISCSNTQQLLGEMAFADSNGFVNYLIFLPSCGILSNNENCFQLQETYTISITGRGLLREETFTTQLKKIETNWFGDFLRFYTVNAQGFLIFFIAIVSLIAIISLFLKRRKNGNRWRYKH